MRKVLKLILTAAVPTIHALRQSSKFSLQPEPEHKLLAQDDLTSTTSFSYPVTALENMVGSTAKRGSKQELCFVYDAEEDYCVAKLIE